MIHQDSNFLQVCWLQDPSSGSYKFQICHAGTQNLVPMSTGPVLLGRVTGLNVGDALDTPKRDGQASPPCHVDIEASPSPTATRVTHGDSQMERPSWTWRCVQMFIALLVVVFTTWLAIALVSQESWNTPTYRYYSISEGLKDYPLSKAIATDQESWDPSGCVVCRIEVAALNHDPSFIALMVSTGIAGLAAMWLYLIAPTSHTLLAARFLCLNWVEGLVTLSFIAAGTGLQIRWWVSKDYSFHYHLTNCLAKLRSFLLLFEYLGLQFLIQNRLQSLWPALNRPGCKVWLAWCLRMEVAIVFLGALNVFLLRHLPMKSGSIILLWKEFADRLFMYGVPTCFLIWSLLVTVTLFRVVLMFQKALELARKQGLAVAATFQACRGRSILQCTGVIISLTTSVMLYFSWVLSSDSSLLVTQCINLLVNAFGIILLSGASSLITSQGALRFPPLRCCRCPRPFGKSIGRSDLKIGGENAWQKKTRELANRGISLEDLLAFYKNLGDTAMQSFQPSVHTTTDVVRLAIIPLTASSCSSYAQLVNKGAKVLPKKMVTHNWSNLFRDLLASVISEALGEHTFEFVAELLSDKAGVEALEDMLRVHGSLQETYWICAFAVNQHAGICGTNPGGTVDPVTGLTHPTCQCSEPKFFNEDPPLNDDGKSIQCEMNKFDDMMALLARENPDFAEVVAVDASLDLFGRAWCVAELAEAHRMGMAQSLKMRNAETLLRRQLTLQGLKVEQMKASRPEDVVEILAKIPDKEAFNAKLQELIFDSNVGLVAAWKNADALQQMEEVSHLLKWLRLSEAVEGGQIVWQRWLP